jgi:hypothetical protein
VQTFKQIAVDRGRAVALEPSGVLWRQVADQNSSRPKLDWQEVDTSELPGRITTFAIDQNGLLVVAIMDTADLYEEVLPVLGRYVQTTTWRQIVGPVGV